MTVSPGPTLIDNLNKPIFLPSLMKSWSKYCWVKGNVSYKCNINVILIVTWWFLRSLALFLSPSTSTPAVKVTNHALILLSFLEKIYGKIPPNSVWPSPCLCSKFRYHFQKIPIIYQIIPHLHPKAQSLPQRDVPQLQQRTPTHTLSLAQPGWSWPGKLHLANF